MDISEQGFMSEIMCPGCGMVNTVHTVLHNFRLERVLGVGGMSIVLQARDMVLNRTLAIKVLKDSYRNNPERVARFEKECSLMAKVRHPNVVSVYSAGAANGQFYIAMELVEGTNLELMVSPLEPMPPLKALSIVRQVAKGLNAANKAGLLHRDIKPGNVLVTRSGRAKVLDFGLSLGKSDADTEETIWATPFYVPPETLLREPEDVRTDIYALGMTLRFLLSGYEAFANIPQTPEELLECKRCLPPIRSKDYKIDEAYSDLINHMTAYDINARPSGYIDLLQELEEVHNAQTAYEEALSPAGQKKSRLMGVLHGLCVMALGLLVAWLTCIICTPAPEHEAIAFSATNSELLQDENLLHDAEEALSQNLLAESAARYMILARRAKDPAMGAWGSFVALYLAELGVAEENRAIAAGSFAEHMKQASPSGASVMEQLRTIMHAASDKEVSLSSQHSLFNAFLHVSRMKYYAQENNKIELQIQQEKALALFELQRGPYANLAPLLKQWGNATELQKQLTRKKEVQNPSSSLAPSEQNNTITSEDFAADSNRASEVSTPALSQNEYIPLDAEDTSLYGLRRKEVVAEMRKVSESIDAMLKRKFLSECRLGMSDADKLKLVAKIKNPQLLEEVRTLYHLIAGELDEAAQRNPYRDTPDSTAPFAVLVQRWLLATAQSKNRHFPHEKIVLVSPKGLCGPRIQQGKRLANGAEGTIVAHSDYGMTLEMTNADGKPRLVDYKRISHDEYCEMPPENEAGVWLDVADTGWRGPCYLVGNTFIHPLSSMKHDAATILHRDANSVHLRWNNDKETVRYVRSANGMYLREGAPEHTLYPLVDGKGTSLALVAKKGGGARLRESIYQTHILTHLEVTAKAITLKRVGSDTNELYELADDGFYHYDSSNNASPSASATRP